jgi:glyoxalase family protein
LAIQGIHHITLAGADAQRTLDFYAGLLGLHVLRAADGAPGTGGRHLYFGDGGGRPGTLVTVMEQPGGPRGYAGIGGTHHLALRAAGTDEQLRWKRYLSDRGVRVAGPYNRRYFTSIYFRDPDGMLLEIATDGPGMAVDEDPDHLGEAFREPPSPLVRGARDEAAVRALTWPEPVASILPGMALRGIHHITAICSDIERTHAFFADTLGVPRVKVTANFDDPDTKHWYWGVDGGRPGTLLTYFEFARGVGPVQPGVGQTHHYALSVGSVDELHGWRDRLLAAGLPVSPVQDRLYYRCVVTVDPDGHTVELAAAEPGFDAQAGSGLEGMRLVHPGEGKASAHGSF